MVNNYTCLFKTWRYHQTSAKLACWDITTQMRHYCAKARIYWWVLASRGLSHIVQKWSRYQDARLTAVLSALHRAPLLCQRMCAVCSHSPFLRPVKCIISMLWRSMHALPRGFEGIIFLSKVIKVSSGLCGHLLHNVKAASLILAGGWGTCLLLCD